MHHVIWIEHDGSWTWSIEEGKAFEDDHKVLARDDGFPTRADAKEDMQKAWTKLLAEGKKPGRPGQRNQRGSKKKTTRKASAAKTVTSSATVSPILPEWAVVVDDKIVALFKTKTAAQKYAKDQSFDSHSVQKIGFGAFLQ